MVLVDTLNCNCLGLEPTFPAEGPKDGMEKRLVNKGNKFLKNLLWAWWVSLVTSAFWDKDGRPKQEDPPKFKACLSYTGNFRPG